MNIAPDPPSISALPRPQATQPMALAASRAKDTPEKILDTARQFEALLLSQILKSVKFDGTDGEEEGSGSALGGIGQEQFAMALAQKGGLGLAQTIARSLAQKPVHPA